MNTELLERCKDARGVLGRFPYTDREAGWLRARLQDAIDILYGDDPIGPMFGQDLDETQILALVERAERYAEGQT